MTRVVPVPQDLSPQAQKSISRQVPDEAPPQSLADRRASQDANEQRHKAEWSKLCPNTIVETQIAGLPVHIVTPEGMPAANNDKVLINLHGGSFNADSGSYAESIPVAGYSKMKVVAVLYRLAPEHPFPAAVDDGIAVYKELLKTYKPSHIAIYGTSAGASLTAEIARALEAARPAHARGTWACSAHSTTSPSWTTRGPSTRCADWQAISIRPTAALTTPITWDQPT